MFLTRARLGVIPFAEGGEARMQAFVAALQAVLGTEIELHRAAEQRVEAFERNCIDMRGMNRRERSEIRLGSADKADTGEIFAQIEITRHRSLLISSRPRKFERKVDRIIRR